MIYLHAHGENFEEFKRFDHLLEQVIHDYPLKFLKPEEFLKKAPGLTKWQEMNSYIDPLNHDHAELLEEIRAVYESSSGV